MGVILKVVCVGLINKITIKNFSTTKKFCPYSMASTFFQIYRDSMLKMHGVPRVSH